MGLFRVLYANKFFEWARYSDYLSYYTEKELNKVHKIYEKYFEKFSYAKETL